MPRLSLDENRPEPAPAAEPDTPIEERDEFLRVDQLVQDGQRLNVIKDDKNRIAFPGPVPQEVSSPGEVSSPKSDQTPMTSEPPAEESLPRKPASDPMAVPAPPSVERSAAGPQRPSVDKKFATEIPGRVGGARARAPTMPLGPRRAGTSFLGQARRPDNNYNWEQEGYYSSSSSSSSESDGDDDADDGLGQHDSSGQGSNRPRRTSAEMRKIQARRERRQREIDENKRFRVGNENYSTKGKMKKDGRLRITVNETANTGYLAKALGQAVKKVVPLQKNDQEVADGIAEPDHSRRSSLSSFSEYTGPKPCLNIVIMVVGSRGDAQPFLKIGKVLKEEYGHRVRIATHPAFRDFVEKDSGLEFFSVGGDPSELMAFMVKNPGMIPTLETVKAGDIGKRRAAMAEMFQGFWRACTNATDDEKDLKNLKMMGEKDPFVADAIIANPPSFAHIHCAEALGIPLHLMFTFPYTPTQAFPHPLASIKKSNVDPGYTNFMSYPLVEMMVWQGLGDLVNDFRTKTLQLDPVSTLWAPGQSYRLHVPFTYLWSPGLVPKPEDWGPEIDVSGFVFLDLASSFNPPSDLEAFLAAGEKPIYIGFGSIVVDDPDKFTQMIFDAVEMAGVRVLLSKGWGGLGGENVPENIFMLDNTPHDWLFPKIQACVIHGGAGTTAIALKTGLPTMVVPFFGDQHFWGSMIGSSGAGPEPVPYKNLNAEKLADGIRYCLTEEARTHAMEIAESIAREGDGAENAVKSFHRHLNLTGINSMRCSILNDRTAVWKLKNTNIKLSAMAADILVETGFLSWRKLRLLRHTEWNDFEGPGEPFTGAAGSLASSVGAAFKGVGSVPYKMAKTSAKRSEKKKKKQRLHELRAQRRQAKAGAHDNLHQHAETKGDTASVEAKAGPEPIGEPSTNSVEASPATDEVELPEEKQAQQNNTGVTNGAPTRPSAQGRLTTGTLSSMETTSTVDNAVEDYAEDVGSGFGQTAEAIAKAPVDLSMAVAQGFHNAPRLYGDDTVRRPPRVTGIRSGLKAARFEFVYGIYDGTTGIVRLPVRGYKKNGAVGLVKGTGMGVGGVFLKYLSAMVGPVSYTMKGVVKQAERGQNSDRMMRRARIVQGQRQAQKIPADQRREIEQEVIAGWQTVKALSEALEHEEKKKGVRSRFHARRRRGMHAAFESVDIAERALAAVKRGEDVSTVVGTEKELRKEDNDKAGQRHRASVDVESSSRRKSQSVDGGARRSVDTARSRDTSHARGGGGGGGGAGDAGEKRPTSPPTTTRMTSNGSAVSHKNRFTRGDATDGAPANGHHQHYDDIPEGVEEADEEDDRFAKEFKKEMMPEIPHTAPAAAATASPMAEETKHPGAVAAA